MKFFVNNLTLLSVAAYLIVSFLISLVVAAQARRRGYSFFIWLLAGTVVNPIFFLVLLAVLPDRARIKRRSRELANLEAKLADRRPSRAKPAKAPTPSERSLGDQSTAAPPERSLGDEETRA